MTTRFSYFKYLLKGNLSQNYALFIENSGIYIRKTREQHPFQAGSNREEVWDKEDEIHKLAKSMEWNYFDGFMQTF